MPLLCSAQRCGAFESRCVDTQDGSLDHLLEELHRRHTGRSLHKNDAYAKELPPRQAKNKLDASDGGTTAFGENSFTPSTISATSCKHFMTYDL